MVEQGGGIAVRAVAASQVDARTLHAVLMLRCAVFVVEQECPYLDVDARDLEPGTVHLVAAASDGLVVGTARLLAEPDGSVRVGRVCTDGGWRQHGVGAALMDRALAEVGVRPAVLDAQTYLVAFYERFGFAVAGEGFLEDGIPHTPMRREPGR